MDPTKFEWLETVEVKSEKSTQANVTGSRGFKFSNADVKLFDLLKAGCRERKIPIDPVYRKSLMDEYTNLCRHGYSSYFVLEKISIDIEMKTSSKTREQIMRERNNTPGSLVGYCIGITDIDPRKKKYNLIKEEIDSWDSDVMEDLRAAADGYRKSGKKNLTD